jgi:hypothetical protein
MMKLVAAVVLALGLVGAAAPGWAGPYLCVRTITDVELVHRVKQDAYFTHAAPPGKRLRLEYDGCGYRIHVGEGSPGSSTGDLLLVDREGRVTNVIRQH